ncbi:iron-containing redox enzyme family protein [Streptomyces sp. NPDC051172]|uniref:iron-containing redox enzyme family protein n=1 Tax=Streptomyces sp. NPDC051172 TaxID=3155796 RepID=UPI00342266D8
MTPPRRTPLSTELGVKLALAAPALGGAFDELWRPGAAVLHARYLAYLYEMHALVRASVPLMERAAVRCARTAPGDPVAEPLSAYLERHIEEERGHDAWLLEDLAMAGGDPAKTADRLPSSIVAELVGAQYYWIEHHHPVALLGYIRVLEGNAPALWLADRLAARTGLPAAAFRTVREHAELDGGHLADLEDLLDSLPLTPVHRTALAVSALRTADGVTRLFSYLATAPGGPA